MPSKRKAKKKGEFEKQHLRKEIETKEKKTKTQSTAKISHFHNVVTSFPRFFELAPLSFVSTEYGEGMFSRLKRIDVLI